MYRGEKVITSPTDKTQDNSRRQSLLSDTLSNPIYGNPPRSALVCTNRLFVWMVKMWVYINYCITFYYIPKLPSPKSLKIGRAYYVILYRKIFEIFFIYIFYQGSIVFTKFLKLQKSSASRTSSGKSISQSRRVSFLISQDPFSEDTDLK